MGDPGGGPSRMASDRRARGLLPIMCVLIFKSQGHFKSHGHIRDGLPDHRAMVDRGALAILCETLSLCQFRNIHPVWLGKEAKASRQPLKAEFLCHLTGIKQSDGFIKVVLL
jgi:hypothetical protein